MTAKTAPIAQLPWLAPARGKAIKGRAARHAANAGLIALLALPTLLPADFSWRDIADRFRTPATVATGTVIDQPFAPKAMRPLSSVEALKWNVRTPRTALAISAAAPFALGAAQGTAYLRSLECMTAAIYYEAAQEPDSGQRAVAQVILNRVRHPAYPHSVCGVVFQGSERKTGCQFSFTCDGSLARAPSSTGWRRAAQVAAAALGGYVHAPVGWATHYHADYVVPYWAQRLEKLATIGRHIFYGWSREINNGRAFSSRYAGVEPVVSLRPATALAIAPSATPTLDDSRIEIVEVAARDRPVIQPGAVTAPLVANPAPTSPGNDSRPATRKAEALPPARTQRATDPGQHPVVGLGSRWIIGIGNDTAR